MNDLDAMLARFDGPMQHELSALHAHRSMGGEEIAGDDLDQRRFAGPIVAHQTDDLTWLQDKRDVGQGLNGAKMLRHILQFENRHGGAYPPFARPDCGARLSLLAICGHSSLTAQAKRWLIQPSRHRQSIVR